MSMELASLIPMLKSHGVTRFEGYGIKVELSVSPAEATAAQAETFAPEDPRKPEPTMDLPGTNDAMNYQAILNWSASPDPEGEESPELPLTGDAPLGDSK